MDQRCQKVAVVATGDAVGIRIFNGLEFAVRSEVIELAVELLQGKFSITLLGEHGVVNGWRKVAVSAAVRFGYNAQGVVDADGSQLILGQRIGTCASDANELIASLESIPASLGKADRALADCGYVNRKAIGEVEAGGTEVFMSVYREDAHAERTYEYRPKNLIKKPKKITDPLLLSMKERLESAPGKAIYAMRAKTVEPVFGIIKQAMGFRQFSLRGKQKIRGEWALVCLAYNLKRLFKLTSQLQTA